MSESEAWVLGQELLECFGLMRRQIIEANMNLFRPTCAARQSRQKCDELTAGMALRGLALYLAGLHIQRRAERERSMPIVFEAMPLRPTGRKRQNRIEAIQGFECPSSHPRKRCCAAAALVSKSGSLLAMYRSSRCGCSRACDRMRCTPDLLIPIAANLRTGQWVLPSTGFGYTVRYALACAAGVTVWGGVPLSWALSYLYQTL